MRKKKKPVDPSKHQIVTRVLLSKPKNMTSNENVIERLRDVVLDCHQLVKLAYEFTKLYLLHHYEAIVKDPLRIRDDLEAYSEFLSSSGPWRKDFFSHVLIMLCNDGRKGRGKPPALETQDFIDSLHKFKVSLESYHIFNDLQLKSNLSHILAYAKDGMLTAYKNNVDMHFDKYIKRLIRSIVKYEICLEHKVENLKDVPSNYPLKYGKLSNLFIRSVMSGNFNDCSNPTDVHQELFDRVKSRVRDELEVALPFGQGKIYDHLERSSLRFAHMVYMNRMLETEFKSKLLRPFPLRTSNIPCNIMIDTAGITDILVSPEIIPFNDLKKSLSLYTGSDLDTLKNKGSLYKPVSGLLSSDTDEELTGPEFKTFIWKSLFDRLSDEWMSKRIRKLESKGLRFNNMITTDGYKVDLHFTDEKSFYAERFKKGSIMNGAKRTTEEDFRYIQELNEPEKHQLEKSKVLFVDPGKGNIITITNGNFVEKEDRKTLVYTSYQRQVESCMAHNRKVYERLTKTSRVLDGKTVKEHLQQLTSTNGKSCDFSIFVEYLQRMKEFHSSTDEFYQQLSHRKRRLRVRLGKQSSEEKTKNRIIRDFQLEVNEQKKVTNAIIVWGNWGRNPNLKNQPPSPGIGYRRSVHRWIPTITVDERYTSSYCPVCEAEVKVSTVNCKRWDKKKKIKVQADHKVHHLLRCQNENCKSRWWNRDVAATFNIEKQYHCYKDNGKSYPFGKGNSQAVI